MKLRKFEKRRTASALSEVGLFFNARFLPSNLVTFLSEINPTLSLLGSKKKKYFLLLL